jgi:imidazolonepropionase-like amidohydrolase
MATTQIAGEGGLMSAQASFTLRGRNPDVLTCIANLSNDEVFTPPEFANRMADVLAEAKVPVVVHPTMQRAASIETYNSSLCNAMVLADSKIPLAIGTGFEGYVPKTRVVRQEAAMAMVNGLGRDRALSAITLDAAKILGIEDTRGSIEPGKAADLVLYDGDPFEHATHVTRTIQEGRVVYDREDYLKLPLARRALSGGGGAGVGCCLGMW